LLISIKEVTLKNFMSYQEEQVFSVQDGTSLIVGTNGLGKSSVIESLFYSLFGKPYRKINTGDLINHIVGKNLEVSIVFMKGQDEFKIVRGLKPQKFEIYKNSELIIQDSKSLDYQKMLEEQILEVNENIFRQLVLLGANIPNSKNFNELSAKEREDLFKYIIDIGIFTEYSDLAKNKLKQLKTDFQSAEDQSNKLEALVLQISQDIQRQEKQNLEFEQTKLSKIQEQETTIKESEELLEKILSAFSLIQIEEKNYLELIHELQRTIQKYRDEKRHNEQKLNLIKKLKETHSGCLACEKLKDISGIEVNEQESLEDENSGLDIKIEETEQGLEGLKKLQEEQNQKKEKFNLLTLKKTKTEELIKTSKEKIKLIEDVQPNTIDYSTLENLKEQRENLIQYKLKLEQDIRDYLTFIDLVSDKNLKGQILDMSLPVINKYINFFLEKFGNFPYLFTINSNLTETIITQDGTNIEKSFNSLSNGQKLRIIFSILFSFLKYTEERNSTHFNILFLDEVLDSSIDLDGRMELINIIRTEFQNRSVIIISHNPDVQEAEELFDCIYQIIGSPEGSKIKQIKYQGQDIE